jgi:hypothetical protein
MTGKLKTVYIPPQSEVSDEVTSALIKACELYTGVEKFKAMLCDGGTTNLVEHLRPAYLEEYLSKIKDIQIEVRVKDTDNE